MFSPQGSKKKLKLSSVEEGEEMGERSMKNAKFFAVSAVCCGFYHMLISDGLARQLHNSNEWTRRFSCFPVLVDKWYRTFVPVIPQFLHLLNF